MKLTSTNSSIGLIYALKKIFNIDCSIIELYVQFMNYKEPSKKIEVVLDILRSVHKNPKTSQRDLAQNLGISLGKLNYLIKSLSDRGFIKIQNFSKSKNKFNYIYVLTPVGIKQKINLTLKFMKIKMKEYDELKDEIQNVDSSEN